MVAGAPLMADTSNKGKVKKKRVQPLASFKDLPGQKEGAKLYDRDWFMLHWICEATGQEQADVLRAIVRDELFNRYRDNLDLIRSLQENARNDWKARTGEVIPPDPLPEEPTPKPGKPKKG